MILYRTKYYSEDAGLSLYDSFKKAYDSHENHPKWMEDLKKECDAYISSYKDNPSNNRFAGWLIEHSPTGREEKDRLTKLARNSENDLIDRFIDGSEFPRRVKKDFEDSKSALERYIETMLGGKQQKELLDRINEGESYKQNLEKVRDFLGNNNSKLTNDKELMKLVSDYKESLEKVIKISEDELSEEISNLNTKIDLLYKDQNLIKDILTNDPVTADVPESFKFKGKTVSLSFDEMGRYMKLQEVAEERFLNDILSQKDGLDKFLGHIYPLTGGSPDKLDAIKSKILEETKNITDPKKKLDITLKNLGVKNKEELFTRFLQECSGYYKCDNIKDTIAKLVSDPKAASDWGFTAKNIQELKKVLDDTAAENVLNKYVMSDPKSLENVVINLEKTEKDIELARAHARIGKKTTYGDIPDFDKNPPANNAAPAGVVKDATTGEVKPSLWKNAVKWVKENPWKSGLIGLGALSIGFAVHQSLKKKEERREERNRDKFDRWKNKFYSKSDSESTDSSNGDLAVSIGAGLGGGYLGAVNGRDYHLKNIKFIDGNTKKPTESPKPSWKLYKQIKDACDSNPETKRIFRSDLRKSIYPRAALGATVGVGSALLANDLYKKYFKNKDKKYFKNKDKK